MKVDENLIKHVAKVARLELTEKEIGKFLPQLKEALAYFSQLEEVETENIRPSFQPVDLKNIAREDSVGECLSQEEALKNTEHKKDGYFKGPKAV